MGIGSFFHHIGTALLLISTALLVVVSVTAPVVHKLSLLKVDLKTGNNGDSITFGTFGYCQLNVNGADKCSSAHVGYQPTDIIQHVLDSSFSNAKVDTAKILTRVMVLHPVAAGLSFLAFLLCLSTSCFGSFVASAFSFISFVATIIATGCDFGGFGVVKHEINDKAGSVASAKWGPAIWCALVAAVLNLVATILVFITCCSGRNKSGYKRSTKGWKDTYIPPPAPVAYTGS